MKLIINIFFLTFLCLVFSKKTNDIKNDDDNNVNVSLSFSLPSGFYNKEKIQLEIKSSHPDAIIYYTLDSHNPTEDSMVYEKALTLKNKSEEENVYSMIEGVSPKFKPPVKKVHKTNIIRAIAKLPDGTFSKIYTGSYFVGLDKKELYQDIPVISLVTDPDNLFDYEIGIYTLGKKYDEWLQEDPENINAQSYQVIGNYNNKGREYERPATFQYIPAHKNMVEVNQDLGIRIKGNASRMNSQKSFRLISRAKYGKKNLKYELIPGNQRSDGKGPITKYKSFNLRNGGNDVKFTKMRDNFLQGLIPGEILETQQNDMVIVFLDGEYWGFYNLYEEYSKHYFADNYDIDEENVAIIKHGKNIEAGSEKDFDNYKEAISFISNNDMSIQSNYDKANELIEIDSYAWASAFYTFIVNRDSWFRGENFAMWRAIEPVKNVKRADGKWRSIIFDIEYGIGKYGYSKPEENVFEYIFDTTNIYSSELNSQLTRSLLRNDKFKNMYINDLCDMVNIIFEQTKINEILEGYRASILPLYAEFYDRFQEHAIPNEDGPIVFFNNEIDKIKNWIKERHPILMNQTMDVFKFKPAVNVTVTSNNFEKGTIILNEYNTFTEKYNGQYFTENILYVTGKPASGRKLKSWTLHKCKMANKNKNTIGVYPKKGCTITANFT